MGKILDVLRHKSYNPYGFEQRERVRRDVEAAAAAAARMTESADRREDDSRVERAGGTAPHERPDEAPRFTEKWTGKKKPSTDKWSVSVAAMDTSHAFGGANAKQTFAPWYSRPVPPPASAPVPEPVTAAVDSTTAALEAEAARLREELASRRARRRARSRSRSRSPPRRAEAAPPRGGGGAVDGDVLARLRAERVAREAAAAVVRQQVM